MSLEKEIATSLIDREAVKVSLDPPFIWSSGIKGPIYCDNRKMIGFVGDRERIVDEFEKIASGLEFDVIGGTATAGIPWAAFLAHQMHMPMVYIRPEKKQHGAGKQIEGYFPGGQKVLIIEDLISTGGSSVRSAQAVRDAGGEVTDILAIVTYEMAKSVKAMEEAKINLVTLTGFSAILDVAVEKGAIESNKLEAVRKFAQDPAGWAELMDF